MGIITPVHSATASEGTVPDTTPLMMPISVGYPSLMGSQDSVSISGAMLQGIVNHFPALTTARVQLMQAQQHRHLLVMIFTVNLPLTQRHPDSGRPPMRSGTTKAATVVVGAVVTVVHRGSGRFCLRRLHLILKFACATQLGLPMIKLALNNLKFTSSNFSTVPRLIILVVSDC